MLLEYFVECQTLYKHYFIHLRDFFPGVGGMLLLPLSRKSLLRRSTSVSVKELFIGEFEVATSFLLHSRQAHWISQMGRIGYTKGITCIKKWTCINLVQVRLVIYRELKVKLMKVLGSRKHAFPRNYIDFYESNLLYALGGRAQTQEYINSTNCTRWV